MALARELAGVSEKLNTAKQEAKSIFTGIVQAQSQISQLASLEERYGQLKSQYESDMNRLDGDKRLGDNAERCPFCDGEIPDDVDFSAANLIEFTKNGSIERYGFLLDQLIL